MVLLIDLFALRTHILNAHSQAKCRKILENTFTANTAHSQLLMLSEGLTWRSIGVLHGCRYLGFTMIERLLYAII